MALLLSLRKSVHLTRKTSAAFKGLICIPYWLLCGTICSYKVRHLVTVWNFTKLTWCGGGQTKKKLQNIMLKASMLQSSVQKDDCPLFWRWMLQPKVSVSLRTEITTNVAICTAVFEFGCLHLFSHFCEPLEQERFSRVPIGAGRASLIVVTGSALSSRLSSEVYRRPNNSSDVLFVSIDSPAMSG